MIKKKRINIRSRDSSTQEEDIFSRLIRSCENLSEEITDDQLVDEGMSILLAGHGKLNNEDVDVDNVLTVLTIC